MPRDCQCAADSAITKMGSIALPRVSTPTVELPEEGRLHLITTAQDAEYRNTCKGLEPNGIVETRVIDSVSDVMTSTPRRLPQLVRPIQLPVRHPQRQQDRHHHRIPDRPSRWGSFLGGVVRRRGHLQRCIDRLDPELVPVVVLREPNA